MHYIVDVNSSKTVIFTRFEGYFVTFKMTFKSKIYGGFHPHLFDHTMNDGCPLLANNVVKKCLEIFPSLAGLLLNMLQQTQLSLLSLMLTAHN